MRKFILNAFVGIVILSLVLAGCSTTGVTQQPTTAAPESSATAAGSTATAQQSAYNELGAMPITKEKKEITILTPWKINAPIDQNWNVIEYEKLSNVKVNWQTVPSDGWMDKVSVIIASGNLPDAIAAGSTFGGSSFTQTQLDQYGSQGVFIPLQDLIESDSMYLKQFLADKPNVKKFVTSLDGNIYGYFDINECYHCNHQQKAWINTTWLKNLGLNMPTTTEELKTVLMAFKSQDPNKNGKPDEIPMATATGGWRCNLDGFLMCSFIYTDSDQNFIFDSNKKIQYAPAQTAWRDGLKYLADLYKNGLIAPESFTQSTQVLSQTNEAGPDPVIGVGFGGVNFTCSGSAVSDKFKQYDAIPPLKGPTGYAAAASYNDMSPANVGMFVITKAAKEPALIMRWLDYFYSPVGRDFIDMGLEGRDWRAGDANEFDFNGNQAKYVELVAHADLINNNVILEQSLPTIRDAAYREGKKVLSQDWREGKGDGELQLFQATKLYDPFAPAPDTLVPTIAALPDKVTDFSLMKTSISDYVKQYVARFITGDLDINDDAAWDAYIKGMNDLGLEKYLAICQEGYDAKYGK